MTARCCVCNQTFGPDELRRLGSRDFCATHYERGLQATRAHLTRSGLIEIGLTAIFVAAVGWALGSDARGELPTSVPMGVLLALVPAFIWLVYVHRQDRLEPEPWGLVLGVFVLGGLFARAVAVPLAEDVFAVSRWQDRSVVASFVAAIAVVATVQQICTYLAVRYTAYVTDEFDEPVDGIIYAAAAGLGLATVLNVEFVVRNEGVLPLAGASFIATTTLVHVASSVVLGYGLGRSRFAERGELWLAGCFAASVVLNGGLGQLALAAGTRNATFRPWVALGVAAGIGALVLVASNVLLARLRRKEIETAAPGGTERTGRRGQVSKVVGLAVALRPVDHLVLGLAALLLAGGLAYSSLSVPRAREVRPFGKRVRLTLPAGWTGGEHDGVYTARRPALDVLGPSVQVRRVPPRDGARPAQREQGEYLFGDGGRGQEPAGLAAELELARMEEERRGSGVGYRVLESEEKPAFGGNRSTWSHFAIIREPPGAQPGSAVVPVIVRGVDVLVTTRRGELWRVSAEAPAEPGHDLDREAEAVLATVRVGP